MESIPIGRESLHRLGVNGEFNGRFYHYSPHIFLGLTTVTLNQVFCWVIYSGPLSGVTMVVAEGGGIMTLEIDICVIAYKM